MKKFILSLFFVICALFNVCGESVKGEIIIPKIERKFVDYDAQNPLKATNVEGIFVVNPYKGNENALNGKGYRIFVLDKNSNELLYVIEDVVIDWHPNHNRGWGGRVVEDDFCLLTKECVEYIIKGDKFDCEIHSYLEGKYLTEDGEDLLRPVIRDDIDEDNKKIEQALVDYIFYPEMVERGFDVHQLDNMKIDGELWEYVESFFRPNDEKGLLPLDNHHVFNLKDENGKWHSRLTSSGGGTDYRYHKRVKFSNEYGTKDELLKKGYVENETMFYYPSNGEKDWRVGEWSWYDWYGGRWDNFYQDEWAYNGLEERSEYLSVLETKKSYVIKINRFINRDFVESIKSFPKKDCLIIDILDCQSGYFSEVYKLVDMIKKSKFKKIIVLMQSTADVGEELILSLKDDKRVIYIGQNSNGELVGGSPKKIFDNTINWKNARISLQLSTRANTISSTAFIGEGIGCLPDIWAISRFDYMKNLWDITKDYELEFIFKFKGNSYNNANIITHDNYLNILPMIR